MLLWSQNWNSCLYALFKSEWICFEKLSWFVLVVILYVCSFFSFCFSSFSAPPVFSVHLYVVYLLVIVIKLVQVLKQGGSFSVRQLHWQLGQNLFLWGSPRNYLVHVVCAFHSPCTYWFFACSHWQKVVLGRRKNSNWENYDGSRFFFFLFFLFKEF